MTRPELPRVDVDRLNAAVAAWVAAAREAAAVLGRHVAAVRKALLDAGLITEPEPDRWTAALQARRGRDTGPACDWYRHRRDHHSRSTAGSRVAAPRAGGRPRRARTRGGEPA